MSMSAEEAQKGRRGGGEEGGGASEKVPLVVQDKEQCANCVLFC